MLLILGDFVQLDGVHLWDNVRIDDGSKISKSIVCTNVHIKRYFLSLARENSQHLATLPLSFPAKCRLRSERKSSVLMTRHYPDPGSASDWLNQISHVAWPMRSTTQIWVVTRHQYGICALVSQTSFGRETSGSVATCRLFRQAISIGHFHDDDVWLQLPEFISSLLSYLNLSIPLRFKEQ